MIVNPKPGVRVMLHYGNNDIKRHWRTGTIVIVGNESNQIEVKLDSGEYVIVSRSNLMRRIR